MIIDMDAHLYDSWFLEQVKLDPALEAQVPPPPVNRNPKEARAKGGGTRDPERQARSMNMDLRWEDAQVEGVGLQIIFPTGVVKPTWTPGEAGVAYCRAYNDWAYKLVDGYRDRFFPVGLTPAGNPELLAEELKRCVKDLGFKAMQLVPSLDRHLDDPIYDPYYQAAQDLDIPLLCHGSGGDFASRFGHNFFSMHIVSLPIDCLTSLVSLVTGGVFERFPRLKVVFFECTAEWIVYWMHRMQDEWEWVKDDPLHARLKLEPQDYIRRNCYVTCESDEKLLGMAMSEFEETHIMMGTDYPHHDSTFPNTVSGIRSRSDISERQKRLILEDNAAALLHL